MKRTLVLLAAVLLFALGLQAQSSTDKSKIMMDMKTMLDAMEEIQSGGLYSCNDCMQKGVAKLQSAIASLSTDDVKKILPEGQEYAFEFAKKRAKMLKLYSDDLLLSVNEGRMDDALDDYAQLLKQCTSCHIRIRNW